MTPLTDTEYVAKLGNVCPFCGDTEELEGGTVEVDAGIAWQEMTCGSCHESWNDVYDLTGYQPI